jgi:twitching motility protein PilT
VESRLDAWLAVLDGMGGSDLLLTDGSRPIFRVDGVLRPLEEADPLTGEEIEAIVRTQIDDSFGDRLHLGREVDFSFTWRNQARIRGNAFYQRNSCSVSLRRIPLHIPTMVELGIPAELTPLLGSESGLILVTGAAGSGKSTSLAAMVDEINRREPCHIITIEDPIEYVHVNERAVVSQREVGVDTRSYATALRSVRREDPDVVVVGEVNDSETVAAALGLADTGRRVIATVTAPGPLAGAERLVEVFPARRREQARAHLAAVLLAVLFQRRVPLRSGGVATEYELTLGLPGAAHPEMVTSH